MKKYIFTFSLFLLPFLFFTLLEVSLRVFNYGKEYPLLLENGSHLRTNQKFPQKYFSKNEITVPELIEQKFPKTKSENTYRILALGGSTTAGFPYEVNINFPYFLRESLQKVNPDKNIEVINLGISAINSHSVLDMLDQVFIIKPDLILIYMGHNEFYGAMGLGSSENIGSNRTLIRLTLWLKDFKFYQLLQNMIFNLSSELSQDESNESLMSQMIAEPNISRTNPLYNKTISNFKDNLSDIADTIIEQGIPLIVSTLSCNLKDQYPLGTNHIKNAEFSKTLNQAKVLMNNNSWHKAIELFKHILADDTTNADTHYNLANCYLKVDKKKLALKHFQKSRDYDLMPFRAPGEINKVIEEIAFDKKIVLAQSEALFKKHSNDSIPGNTLFLEHLHPNTKGYALLSKSFESAIDKLEISLKTRSPLELPHYMQTFSFTALDQRIGEIKVKNLLEGFPFNGRSELLETEITDAMVDTFANQHIYEGLFWDGAHFELGDYFQGKGDYTKALAEYFAVYKYDPTNPSVLYRIGDIYATQENYTMAVSFYNKALEQTPNEAYLYAKLGRVLMISEKTNAAISALEQVIQLEKKKKTLDQTDMKVFYYLLGLGYARLGEKSKANEAIQASLKIDPTYTPSIELKQQIKKLSDYN